jgi:hypothetical protein
LVLHLKSFYWRGTSTVTPLSHHCNTTATSLQHHFDTTGAVVGRGHPRAAQRGVLGLVRPAVCCLLSAVCCLLSGVWCLVSGVCCLVSAICCLLFARFACSRLSTVNSVLPTPAVSDQLSAVCLSRVDTHLFPHRHARGMNDARAVGEGEGDGVGDRDPSEALPLLHRMQVHMCACYVCVRVMCVCVCVCVCHVCAYFIVVRWCMCVCMWVMVMVIGTPLLHHMQVHHTLFSVCCLLCTFSAVTP